MRSLRVVAALVVLACLPHAQAGASSVSLDGPASVRAERATTVELRVALVLDGVVCTSAAEIPVSLRVVEATGMRSAQLALEEIAFSLAAHEAATGAWRKEAVVPLSLWTEAASGLVRVSASYALPSQCTAIGGPQRGEATHVVRVEGPAAEPPARSLSAPRSESLLAPAPAAAPSSTGASGSLPMPVVGAILGTLAGGAVVAVKRLRALRA